MSRVIQERTETNYSENRRIHIVGAIYKEDSEVDTTTGVLMINFRHRNIFSLAFPNFLRNIPLAFLDQ